MEWTYCKDNADDCRKRMFEIFDNEYKVYCKKEASDECREAVRFILKRNILFGDALTLKGSDGEPIIFSEWALVSGPMMQRRDYRLDEILDGHAEQMTLFMTDWEFDEEVQAFIPKPIKRIPVDRLQEAATV